MGFGLRNLAKAVREKIDSLGRKGQEEERSIEEGTKRSPGSSTRASVTVMVVNVESYMASTNHPYNIDLILAKIIEILQIE